MEDFFERNIDQALNQIEDNNQNILDTIHKFKMIRKDVTCKSENNMLHYMIDQKIGMLEKALKQNGNEYNILEKLQEALKDYGFDGDTREQPQMRTVYFGGPTGGTYTASW